MRTLLLVLAVLLAPSARAATTPASPVPVFPVPSAFTPAELAAVALAPPPGAALPLDIPLVDEDGRPVTTAGLLAGRPAVVVFADYTCTLLCGTALGIAAAALEETRLRPGQDFALLVLGLDPRDGPVEAAALKAARLGRSPVAPAARFLSGDAAGLARAAAALGYTARYDARTDEYAHPLGALVLTGDGRVSRALGGLDLDPDALRLALVEASAGRVGTLGERLRLLCYGFDGARGGTVALVKRALAVGSVVTTLGLALFLVLLTRRARRA